MSNLKIRDGRFVNNRGQLVKAEFGNRSQIDLMNRLNNACKAFNKEGMYVRYAEVVDGKTWVGRAQFMCSCGREISYTNKIDHDFDTHPVTISCYCKLKYKITNSEFSEFEVLVRRAKA